MAMKQEDVYRLRINRPLLVQTIDVKYVLNPMVAAFVLDIDDDERIRAEKTTQDKAAKFLNCLEKSRSPQAYTEFRKALVDNYPDLVITLDDTDIRQVQQRLGVPVQEQTPYEKSTEESTLSENSWKRKEQLSSSQIQGSDCTDGGTDSTDGSLALQSNQSLGTTRNVGKVSGKGHFVVMAGNRVNININK